MSSIMGVLEQTWQLLAGQIRQSAPNLLAAVFTVFVGILLGRLAGVVATRLMRARSWDRGADRWGLGALAESLGILSIAGLLARLLEWLIILVTLEMALRFLHPALANELELRFFLYLPNFAVAVVILAAGHFLSRYLARSALISAVNAGIPQARLLGRFVRAAILLVAVAMAIEHLGIGHSTVLVAFAILFGGVTLAGALAIGLGSRNLVRQWLQDKSSERSVEKPEEIHHW
jgi:hypothetical protein